MSQTVNIKSYQLLIGLHVHEQEFNLTKLFVNFSLCPRVNGQSRNPPSKPFMKFIVPVLKLQNKPYTSEKVNLVPMIELCYNWSRKQAAYDKFNTSNKKF